MKDLWITGFDSAWSGRTSGAICTLRRSGDQKFMVEQLEPMAWAEAEHIVPRTEGNHVVAIDQPLVVRNLTGHRPVDLEIAKSLMGPYACGAHAANRSMSYFGDNAPIWRFLDAMESRGYREDPRAVAENRDGRFYFECYPNLAIIGMLGTLPRYKIRHKNQQAWNTVLQWVLSLSDPVIENLKSYLPMQEETSPTKADEDKLDAVICAYVAAHLWTKRESGSLFIGSIEDGYVVIPVDDTRGGSALRNALKDASRAPFPEGRQSPAANSRPSLHSSTGLEVKHDGFDGIAELVCTDPGNLWAKANEWMKGKTDQYLVIALVPDLEKEQREIRFVPFDQPGPGMKPNPNPIDRSNWAELTGSNQVGQQRPASKQNLIKYRVEYRFQPEPFVGQGPTGPRSP